jgi:hypothetical protein
MDAKIQNQIHFKQIRVGSKYSTDSDFCDGYEIKLIYITNDYAYIIKISTLLTVSICNAYIC